MTVDDEQKILPTNICMENQLILSVSAHENEIDENTEKISILRRFFFRVQDVRDILTGSISGQGFPQRRRPVVSKTEASI